MNQNIDCPNTVIGHKATEEKEVRFDPEGGETADLKGVHVRIIDL